MVGASIFFQHKKVHKGIWIFPDNFTLNKIGLVLVNKIKEKLIQDVRTLGGPKCDSDYFLVKVIIKQKLITTRNKFTEN